MFCFKLAMCKLKKKLIKLKLINCINSYIDKHIRYILLVNNLNITYIITILINYKSKNNNNNTKNI